MKWVGALLLIFILLFTGLAGCTGKNVPGEGTLVATTETTATDAAPTASSETTTENATGTTESVSTQPTTGDATTNRPTATGGKVTTTTVPTTAKTDKEPIAVTTTTKPAEKTECRHAECREATCTVAAICLKCGRMVGKPLGHAYVNNVCTRCGEKSPEYMSRVEVLGVELNESSVDLLVGDTLQLACTLTPKNATDQEVTWTSSNPAAVEVSSTGKLTGVALGVSTITVSSVNGKKATCKVTVGDIAVELPALPTDLRYPADYSKKSWILAQVTDVQYRYTQTGTNEGELLLQFIGSIAYAGDGDGHLTTPSIGWRLYKSGGGLVSEGVVKGAEAMRVGSTLKGMTAEVQGIAPGRYRLELYSTYQP